MPPLVTDLVQRYFYMAMNYVTTLEYLDKTPQSGSAAEIDRRRREKVQRIAKK